MPEYVAIVCRTPGVAVAKRRKPGKPLVGSVRIQGQDYAEISDWCREYNQRLKRSRRRVRAAYRAINRKQSAPAFSGYLVKLKEKIGADLVKVEAGEIVECP